MCSRERVWYLGWSLDILTLVELNWTLSGVFFTWPSLESPYATLSWSLLVWVLTGVMSRLEPWHSNAGGGHWTLSGVFLLDPLLESSSQDPPWRILTRPSTGVFNQPTNQKPTKGGDPHGALCISVAIFNNSVCTSEKNRVCVSKSSLLICYL
jgi:hypothetical protein